MHIGIDTSCYTTSVAAVGGDGILFDKRIMLRVEKGKRGLRQSDAVFEHTRNLSKILSECDLKNASSVSVSARPRGTEGSYMPVFLSGVCAARAIQSASGCKYYEFSHQQGHIMAGLFGANVLHWRGGPFLALHISGGTTEMLLVNSMDDIKIVGKTLDISAGQLIDRVGVRLGLDFPCGKGLELLARDAAGHTPLPVSVSGADINFSGAETKAMRMEDAPSSIAAAVLDCVAKTVGRVVENTKSLYNIDRVLIMGGVASNRQIRRHIGGGAVFAEGHLCCDNAVGTALLGRSAHI